MMTDNRQKQLNNKTRRKMSKVQWEKFVVTYSQNKSLLIQLKNKERNKDYRNKNRTPIKLVLIVAAITATPTTLVTRTATTTTSKCVVQSIMTNECLYI